MSPKERCERIVATMRALLVAAGCNRAQGALAVVPIRSDARRDVRP